MPATKKKTTDKSKLIRFDRNKEYRTSCWFCENEVEPDYKELEIVRSFLSPRGKILARRITGTCAKHQRALSRAIKIARTMALIR